MSQPKALFLADVLHNDPCSKSHHDEAAFELRRLHAENEALLQALKMIAGTAPCVDNLMSDKDIARAAIAKAEEA